MSKIDKYLDQVVMEICKFNRSYPETWQDIQARARFRRDTNYDILARKDTLTQSEIQENRMEARCANRIYLGAPFLNREYALTDELLDRECALINEPGNSNKKRAIHSIFKAYNIGSCLIPFIDVACVVVLGHYAMKVEEAQGSIAEQTRIEAEHIEKDIEFLAREANEIIVKRVPLGPEDIIETIAHEISVPLETIPNQIRAAFEMAPK